MAGTNTITATGPASMTGYSTGQIVRFIPANTNTAATTLNITPSGASALGAKNVFLSNAALVGGEIRASMPVIVMYDGTQFQIVANSSMVPAKSGAGPFVLAQSFVAVAAPGDTSENTLATYTILAASMGPNGSVTIKTTWSCTNNANAKTARIKFGGTNYQALDLASTAGGQSTVMIGNRNSASSQVGSVLGITDAATVTQISSGLTTAINTGSAVTILITGQKGTGGDTLTLETVYIEILYGA